MNTQNAIHKIQTIFKQYKALTNAKCLIKNLQSLTNGKLYELYVLSDLLEELKSQGFSISFCPQNKNNSIVFKRSPGKIQNSDSYFVITCPNKDKLFIFLNIEFQTLSSTLLNIEFQTLSSTLFNMQYQDRSQYHEIDIIVTDINSGYPTYKNIFLGIECKSTAKFQKNILKEVLGIRRELSLYKGDKESQLSLRSNYARNNYVTADTGSEYRLAFIDPIGMKYENAGKIFSIEFKHIQP